MAALSNGCTPTCKETCRHVLDCEGESSRVTQQECVDACMRQEALYKNWDDEEKKAAFDDERTCLRQSTCEEINAGVCYDEELFQF